MRKVVEPSPELLGMGDGITRRDFMRINWMSKSKK